MLVFEHFVSELAFPFNKDGRRLYFTPASIDSMIQAVPLVFQPTKDVQEVSEHDQSIPLDLPFKRCFFEMLDGTYITSGEASNSERGEDESFHVVGIYVEEVSPREYHILMYTHNKRERTYLITYIDNQAVKNHLVNIVSELLKRFHAEQVGQSNPRTHLKVKSQGTKHKARLSRVVYISPKKYMGKTESSARGMSIEWSHRFQVRGHWRSIPGRIGKDREGSPISEFTWVSEYVKGPEGAPLVSKPRVVRSEVPYQGILKG